MKKSLLTLAALLALSACSSSKKEDVAEAAPVTAAAPVETVSPTPMEPHWSRPNTSIAETAQQVSRCEYDVGMNTGIADSKRHDMFEACMQKEGYSWIE